MTLPEDFINYTKTLTGNDLWGIISNGLAEEPPVSIRLNPFKCDGDMPAENLSDGKSDGVTTDIISTLVLTSRLIPCSTPENIMSRKHHRCFSTALCASMLPTSRLQCSTFVPHLAASQPWQGLRCLKEVC